MDEPTAGFDEHTERLAMGLLRERTDNNLNCPSNQYCDGLGFGHGPEARYSI